ncbi:Putative nitrate excretion transporter 4 [Apostasia shenzhenica]|uniref:Nitrate excretion transporter 4 n=1 Tax=Apostasia shenzhenica TaxID=1088818 RepID=A0A2I0BGD9_9ASPA|nr:Putative nitrate excretion transporter 4 [Apostasia shenzhenica]
MALPGDPSYASPSPPAEQATEMNAGATSEISQPLNTAGAHGVLSKRGGWITFPFLAVNILGTSLAAGGAMANFIVYLIKVFNFNSIEAAKINNVFLGSINLTAVVGAMLSDAFFGRFPVIVFSSIISLLSTTLFTLTAAVPSFHPPPCSADGGGGSHCQLPSAKQLALLYSAMALLAVATGGARFNTITMGAEQFDRANDREAFFNWYYFIVYVSLIIGSTAIVYVEDNLSWQLGFGICTALSAVSLTVLISGLRFYRRQKARGSPFTGLARVVVAVVRKRKIPVGSSEENYYSGDKFRGQTPSRSLRYAAFWSSLYLQYCHLPVIFIWANFTQVPEFKGYYHTGPRFYRV